MVGLLASAEKALAADPGKNYCTDCLGQAAGLTLEEELVALAQLMRTKYKQAKDRVVEKGVCSVCRRTELVVRRGS